MDRIRKALDLARADRARFLGNFEPEPETDGAAEPVVDIREIGTPSPRLSHLITYTKTQVYEPRRTVLESNRIVDPLDSGAVASAFRMLRTQVLQRLDERGWRSMAVLSAGPNDGKTTTAINLAVNLASDNRHTVLLVDCDLRRPGVAAGLDIAPEFGVDDVLCGKARVDQCLYHPRGIERLVVLPARSTLSNSSEALSSSRGRAFVQELRARYPERILLFDLPPILGADDAVAFLPMVECALVVVAERRTPRDDLLRCMELTRSTPIIGTVLNRSTGTPDPYA
jgi:protein-tyrosine kinase